MKWDIRYLFPFTRLVTLSGSARHDEKRLNPASMMCSRVTKPGLMIGCRNSSEYLFEGLKLWRSGDFSELPHNEGCACLGVGASQSHSWESDRASAGIGMDTASEDFIKKKKKKSNERLSVCECSYGRMGCPRPRANGSSWGSGLGP